MGGRAGRGLLGGLRQTARRHQRLPAGLVRRHAATNILGRRHFEVSLQLFAKVVIVGPWPVNRPATRASAARRYLMGPPLGREKGGDQVGGLVPLARLPRELLASRGGERVELGATIVLGLAPLRLDEALLLELEERGIQGAVIGETDLLVSSIRRAMP